MVSRSTRDDRGETLVELMVTLVIMATAVVAVVGGIATSIRVSDIHRKQAKSQAYVRAFAETIEASVAAYPSGYHACTGTTTPADAYKALFPVPAPDTGVYNVDITAVAYWNGATSSFVACPGAADAGVQRLTLSIFSTDGRASETLEIVVRKPCRPPVDPPLSSASYPDDPPCT
jgi:type II secretory pathway pseudopilin PulG